LRTPEKPSRSSTTARSAPTPGCAPIGAVTGGVELPGIEFGEGASREHYTLCRCGASKNKPFCDGTHWHIGFEASGLSIVPGESR
jgi:hypothetical protein